MSDHLFQQLLVHNSKFSFSVKSLRFEDHPLDKLLDILYNSKYNPHHHPQSKENIPPPLPKSQNMIPSGYALLGLEIFSCWLSVSNCIVKPTNSETQNSLQ